MMHRSTKTWRPSPMRPFDELPEIGAFEVDEGSALPVDLDLDASPKSATVVQRSLAESLNRVVSGDDPGPATLRVMGGWLFGRRMIPVARVTDLLIRRRRAHSISEIERTTALDMSSIETGSAEPIEAKCTLTWRSFKSSQSTPMRIIVNHPQTVSSRRPPHLARLTAQASDH